MKVAISEKPLSTGHKVRGIGSYTRNLIDVLEKKSEIEIVKFSDLNDVKDVDLIHYPWYDFFFRTLKTKKNIPTVVTVHDVIPLIFPEHFPVGVKGKINFFYQRLALRRCKLIITDSENSKKDIIKYLGIKSEKIRVVPFAAEDTYKILPDTKLVRVKNQYKLPDKFLLYVGDVNYTKNIPFLIKAFLDIKEDPKFSDLGLVLVGQSFARKIGDATHPELRPLKEVNNLIDSSNFSKDILRLGFVEVEDLVAIYNLATAYVQPSLYEGFGIPVLEAMQSGTPVISSNRSSLPEIGGDAVTFFDPTDLGQFTKTIRDVLSDNKLRNKLSEKSLKQVEKFSLERVADETIKVYKEAVS